MVAAEQFDRREGLAQQAQHLHRGDYLLFGGVALGELGEARPGEHGGEVAGDHQLVGIGGLVGDQLTDRILVMIGHMQIVDDHGLAGFPGG